MGDGDGGVLLLGGILTPPRFFGKGGPVYRGGSGCCPCHLVLVAHHVLASSLPLPRLRSVHSPDPKARCLPAPRIRSFTRYASLGLSGCWGWWLRSWGLPPARRGKPSAFAVDAAAMLPGSMGLIREAACDAPPRTAFTGALPAWDVPAAVDHLGPVSDTRPKGLAGEDARGYLLRDATSGAGV